MTSHDFKQYVLHRFYQDIHVMVADNYAPERFSFDGVDRSLSFDVAKHAAYLDWFTANYEDLFAAYERFADQASQVLFIDLIRYRLAGHLHVKIDSELPGLSERRRLFKERFAGAASALPASGMFGALVHYDAEWENVSYTVDTTKDSLINYLVNRQYFFCRDGVVIQPESGDHVIDGGAFTGETAVVFSRVVGPVGRVYAFDPVQNHLDISASNVRASDATNVTLFGYGLSDRTSHAAPIQLAEYSPGWRVNGSAVPLCRIDDFVATGQIERIDFIKMDVEGSELAALRGAIASIRRFRPKMAISIYHQPGDFFAISRFINELELGYKLYLGHYTIWDEETVLYAIAS